MSQLTLGTAMHLRIESSVLTDALRLVLPFAQGGIPVYAGVQMSATPDELILEASNGDERVVTTVSAGITTPGRAIVPAQVLNAFLRSVSGAVEITQGEDALNVACGSSSLELHTMAEADWPLFAQLDGPEFELTPEMWSGVRRVMHAQGGTDDKTANRHCVRFDHGGVMAHNGRRCAIYDIEGLKATSNIPGSFISTLAKLIDPKQSVFVRFADRMGCFRSGATEWMCRPVVDSYPDLRSLIRAESPYTLVIARNDLGKALARTGILPEQSAWKQVQMERIDNELVLTATGPDVGKTTDVIACGGTYEGPPLIMNIPELKSLADNSVEDELTFQIVDIYKGIQVVEGPWAAMLMPRRPPTAPTTPAPPTSSKANPNPSG